MADDIRWKQRFHNYTNALQTLTEAVALGEQRPLTKLEKQGLIQGFELTHELGWNVLKDYLQSKGYTGIIGSRDATRLALSTTMSALRDAQDPTTACANTLRGWGRCCMSVGMWGSGREGGVAKKISWRASSQDGDRQSIGRKILV